MGQGKIAFARVTDPQGPGMALGVAGSGSTACIKHLQKDLMTMATAQVLPHHEFEKQVAAAARKFHREYVIPFAAFPERPNVSLLIGYYHGQSARLWSTSENLLTESRSYAAIGAGAMYANILLSRLFLPLWPMDTKVAALLADYVVNEVKEHIDGCGKDTDIACIGPYSGCFLDRFAIRQLDDLLDSISGINTGVIRCAFSGDDAFASTKKVLAEIKSLRQKLDKIWHGFRAEIT